MPLNVNFRVVGVYCYFPNLSLEDVNPDSTVKDVMDSIRKVEPNFTYSYFSLENQKLIVDDIKYFFDDNSYEPPNASVPVNGHRDLSSNMGNTALVWQYYRSVTGKINGTVCEISLRTNGQESFATKKLNDFDESFSKIPEGFEITAYNLTWRLLQIQLSPEKKAEFMRGKANAILAS